VVPRVGGRLASLLVSEGEIVKENQPLALIYATANYKEVMKLADVVGKTWYYIQHKEYSYIEVSPSDYKNIGELQGAFQSFYSAYIQMHSFILKGLFYEKKSMLQKDLINNDSMKYILLKQKSILENDYMIAESDYKTKDTLYKENVIAKTELKQEESKLLAKKLPVENLKASLMSNNSTYIDKEKEIMDLDKQYEEVHSNFIQSLNKLAGDIESWKQQYVIIAPISGIVTFPEIVQENQELVSGKEIFYIESPEHTCYAQAFLDQDNFGKLSIGQSVIIRLPSYPFQEYGSLQGRIIYISHIPNKDKQYMVKISLDSGLITNTGFRINFINELTADAEIITKKEKILYKFLYTVRGAFHRTNPAKKKNNEKAEN
jgi:HlyD family secretion protein